MRVCFVSRRYFPAISGMSVYAHNLLGQLVAAGHEVTMVSQYRGDAFGMSVYGGGPPPPVPGVRVIGLEQLGEQQDGNFERDIAEISAVIIAEHERAPFDVLHAQYGYPTGWATLLASREIGVPTVVSIQGGDGHWVGACCDTHRVAMQCVIDYSGSVLIGCASFAAEVTQRLDTVPDCFTIVPGAVDTNRFHPALRAARNPPALLYHGRVDARKGVLDLLDALGSLARESVDFRLVISGIGPSLDEAQAQIVRHGLHDHVTVSGHVEYADVPAVYRQADIFVSPTYAEGFSNTILEAMASGLAIVSCTAVGVVDCITNDVTGLLSGPGDVGMLASNLRLMLTQPALRARLAAAGLAECRRRYSWQSVGQQIMQIYASLVGSKPRLDWEVTLPSSPCRFRAEPHLL